MQKRKWAIILIFLLEVLLAVGSNLLLLRAWKNENDLGYRVELGRVRQSLKEGIVPKASGFSHITDISVYDPDRIINEEYTVFPAKDGTLYQITYRYAPNRLPVLLILNGVWVCALLLTAGILIYIYRKILRPFRDMAELPVELSKGNLSIPVKEEQDRYFGRFLWGMDMLRDKLETDKNDRLAMEQEKKTLILTMSHDIKTPLSAIKLYNKALSGNLYETEERKQEAYAGIERNLEELEKYIEEIQSTARDDFLQIQVSDGEWYLSEVMYALEKLYKEKTAEKRTSFTIEPYQNCLIKGDKERGLEVLQNLMENALKYGDGRSIRITFADEEDCRLVTVESSGCTLPERELPNIFDSFYRGSNAENQKGSGLGLYICRRLMQAMDGEIFAEVRGDVFAVTAVFRKR